MPFTCSTWLKILSATVLVLLTGCARYDYPQEWGSNAATPLPTGCPNLTGTYSTHATESYPAYGGPYPALNDILGPAGLNDMVRQGRPWPELAGATTATFTQDGTWLSVHFHDAADGKITLRFKQKHWWGGFIDGADGTYLCHQLEPGPALGIDGARQPAFAVPDSFSKGNLSIVFLSKGQDGALIVNYQSISFSVKEPLVGIWADWAGGIWWRYPAIEQNR